MLLRKTILAATLSSFLLTGCVTTEGQHPLSNLSNTQTGALIGALGGAAAGALSSNKDKRGKNALIGAIGGGLLGTAIGAYMDQHRNDLLKQLQSEINAGSIIVNKRDDHSILVTMTDATAFDINSAVIKSGFHPTLNKIANVVKQYGKTTLHITGHTDNTGGDQINQSLSTARALSVRNYLANHGVIDERLSYQGLSSLMPRADNATEAGRRLNRRVEVLILPVQA